MSNNKTLFVLKRASMGGSCASLINLLSLYKEQGRVYDLFLMDHTGEWTDEIRPYANLLPADVELEASVMPKEHLKTLRQRVHRVLFTLSHRLRKPRRPYEALYKRCAKRLTGYDHVIAYQESETTEFVRFIPCPHRIAFMHNDVERFWLYKDKSGLQKFYEPFQDIACVSDACVQSVRRYMTWPEEHLHWIRNTLPEGRLRERSLAPVAPSEEKAKPFLFVSVGRMAPQKAFERIPRAARLLKQKGLVFDWYVLGDGPDKEMLVQEVAACDVQDCVHLLGARMNPHSYVRIADCLVITSNYEAQPMVANESLILDTPVISTEFSSVREVIRDGEIGLIVPQTPEALAEAMERFMTDAALRETLTRGANEFRYPNDKELQAIDRLIEA